MSSARSTLTTSNEEASASATDFSPSTVKSPSSSRNFFSRSERMDFISALVSISTKIAIRRQSTNLIFERSRGLASGLSSG